MLNDSARPNQRLLQKKAVVARQRPAVKAVVNRLIVSRHITNDTIKTFNYRRYILKNIKVLGSGCANCKATLKLIDEAAKNTGIDIEMEKVEDIGDIMSYGVMSTPGVVIDGKVVHAGGIPDRKTVDNWLAN